MTLPNFTEYVPPGVYWQQSATPISPQSAGLPNGVAIVGPGIGYRTFSEAITLTGTDPVALSKEGVDGSSIIVSANGTTYAVTTDYVVTTSGSGPTTVTSIASNGEGSITSGETVTVSYQYTDATYTIPTQISDAQTVQNLYGPAFDPTTGDLMSPLTLASNFAFANGAKNLVLVATTGTVTPSVLNTSIELLSTVDTVSIVVPLPVGLTSSGDIQSVDTDLSVFVDAQSDLSNFMIGILGYENGPTANAINPISISSNSGDERVVVAYPNSMTYYTNNTSNQIAGYYLAAAYAGTLAGNPVQRGLTRQRIVGFSGIDPVVYSTMTTSQKNTWSAGGVAVSEIDRNGNLVVTREIPLVRAQDAMIDTILQTVINAGIIGSPITANTSPTIAGLVNIVLASLKAAGVIENYTSISVTESTGDPTIMNVTFLYVPAYPLNYIAITFGIDTTTGSTTATSGTTLG